MEKTITISGVDVTLNNNANWFFIYRDQFGHDIIPTLMPMLATTINLASGLLDETGKSENVTISDVLALADSEAMTNALIHLSGMEIVDVINITWALAKNGDETIEEPARWVKQFDVFPFDVVIPEIVKLVVSGTMTSKNLERLQGMKNKITLQPEKKQKKTK